MVAHASYCFMTFFPYQLSSILQTKTFLSSVLFIFPHEISSDCINVCLNQYQIFHRNAKFKFSEFCRTLNGDESYILNFIPRLSEVISTLIQARSFKNTKSAQVIYSYNY